MRKVFLTFGLAVSVAGFVWAEDPPLTQAQKEAWHGEMALGLSLAKGNSDTFQLNASAAANKLWGQNELHLGIDGAYALNHFGRTNEEQTANNIHGFVDYKRLFTERFYGDARIDGLHDEVSEVHYRVIVGPAVGYFFIKTDKSRVNAEIGPSFIEERLDDTGDHGYVTLRISERAERVFNKGSKVWEQVDYLPQVDDLSHYLLNAEAGAEAALNTHFSLRVVVADKYNSEPAPGRKCNDILLISALVYKY